MNLDAPPRQATLEEINDWVEKLYEFLKLPAFNSIVLVPRVSVDEPEIGMIYYDSDDNKFKIYNGSSFSAFPATIWNDLIT